MLRDQTLFVVGAGASAEYKLPVGDALKQEIAQVLNKLPDESSSAIGRMIGAIELYAANNKCSAAQLIAKGRTIAAGLAQAPSIDAYIENQRHDPEIAILGKIAIAACLLDRERACPLFVDTRRDNAAIDFHTLSPKWLAKLFQILIEGQTKATLPTFFDRATFVVFNYDRCVEHYFEHSLRNYFGLSQGQAEGMVRSCRIIHPYGTLGPWGWPGTNPDALAFGASGAGLSFSSKGLLTVAERDLRTYSEYIEDAAEVQRNQAMLHATDTIVYLGFAFHQQNVQLLSKIVPHKRCRVLATTFKVPEPALDIITEDIARIMKVARAAVNPMLANLECGPFIDSYRLLLSQR